MVAVIRLISSTDAAQRFYLDNQPFVRPTRERDPRGFVPDARWINPTGMFGLPDREPVRTSDFLLLFRGLSPVDGSKLTYDAATPHRCAGVEITFIADKSVSALWAIIEPEERAKIETAHEDAIRDSYERLMLPQCAYTRRRTSAGHIQVLSADLIAAVLHRGQDQYQSPHLHSHIVCFSGTRTHNDGKYRRLYTDPAYEWIEAMGARYRAALAWNLQERLGVRMERYGDGGKFTRIVGMPRKLVEHWATPDFLDSLHLPPR